MSQPWIDVYRRHFQRQFGKPFDVQVYHDAEGFALKVATHDNALPGFGVFASLGLADALARNDDADIGEAILYTDVRDKEMPQVFINALFFILQNAISLGSRFAVGFGNPAHPLAKRYGKTALYFTRPANDERDFCEVPSEVDGAVGEVYQAFLITPEEDAFLEEHGADAFEERLRKQFGGKLSDEEKIDLLVDKQRAKELEARTQELWQQIERGLSVRRPSCV